MTAGLYTIVRESSTSLTLYRNTTAINSAATATTAAAITRPAYAWAVNSSGTAASHTAAVGSFISYGAAMTAAQLATYYAIVQTFQTNLGRQV
jgi:hypothetical protein